MLKKRIEKEFVEAFKERNILKKTLLSTIKGAITQREKKLMATDLPDNEVIAILNSFMKAAKENIELGSNVEQAQAEIEIMETFLPTPLTEAEITTKIEEAIANGATNLGQVMKVFVNLPADKALVSKITKEKLS